MNEICPVCRTRELSDTGYCRDCNEYTSKDMPNNMKIANIPTVKELMQDVMDKDKQISDLKGNIKEIIDYVNNNPYPEDVFVSLKSQAIRNLWKNWNRGVLEKVNELKKETKDGSKKTV